MDCKYFIYFLLYIICSLDSHGQVAGTNVAARCGTMERQQNRFNDDPALKAVFEQEQNQFNRIIKEGRNSISARSNRLNAIYTIPVVFHIVLGNPALVTDAQVKAQLDTLNKEFSGANPDTSKLPLFFRSLFGVSGINFCLAQRTPDGEVSSGIERVVTNNTSFSFVDDRVKHAGSGGAESWDAARYFNIWICVLDNNIAGYSTLPQDGIESDQGVVIDHRSLPGGSFTTYNRGKTLVHETGHYFNLYHTWGDDEGACTGSDFIDDTPNQADATTGCFSGIKTDKCTTSGNGIMYQNFMDYTDDACMILFTREQVARMETALTLYRSPLLISDGCQPVIKKNFDVQLVSIDQPGQRLCSPLFNPAISIKNRGTQTLSSFVITISIDGTTVVTSTWNGSLAPSASTTVVINDVPAPTGNHLLSINVSLPNNNVEEAPLDNNGSLAFQYFPPVTAVSEGFENTGFITPGWDIFANNGIAWKRVTGVAKTGNASIMINNIGNRLIGQKSDLRLPGITLPNSLDTVVLSFQVAAATYTSVTTQQNNWDTLEVLVSTDCGASYLSLYKKWGSSLVTRQAATQAAFIPATSEWRKDSINLAAYIGMGNLLFAFRNTNGNENNIYLDDINLRTVTVNPNLKTKGFLVSPNPTSGSFTVQFFPQPSNLLALQVYTISGQKIIDLNTTGRASNNYLFNIGNQASGTYLVRAVFTDRVVVQKIVRY